ncbi:MAG: tyrosine-type recombinase/integrase [Actinomycetota bacterium]
MTGSIVKKANRWYVIIEQRDPQTGARRRKWHSGYRTRREAEAARTDILSRIQRGVYIEPSAQTLGRFLLDDWLPAKRTTVRATTHQSYEQVSRAHIIPRLGAVPLRQLKASTLNSLYADLLVSGRCDGRGGLSPKTVRNTHVVIRKALSDAVRWSLLALNPADSADPPRLRDTGSTTMRTWTAAELRAFLESVENEENGLHPLFVLAGTTGMRRGELLGLRWRDVELQQGRLSVQQTVVSVAYELHFSTPKTKRGQRSIALDPHTTAILRDHRVKQNERRLLAGPLWTDHDLVFCRNDGGPIHPDYLSKLLVRLVAASGLPRIRLHDLRHTHATLALAAGIHPKAVGERLGHADTSITLDTYSHVIPALQESAAETVARLVFAAGR